MVRILMVTTAIVGFGCARSETSGWAGSVTDSAGVTLVNNVGGSARLWSVEPVLSIGQESGDEAYVFGRIADVTVDSQNRIHVLDQHAHVVRTYGADGVFIRSVGREGQGPGEFSDFVNAVLVGVGDSIFVPESPPRTGIK